MLNISRHVTQCFYLHAVVVVTTIFSFLSFTGMAQRNDKPKPPAVRPTPKPPDGVVVTSSKPGDPKVNFKTKLLVVDYPGPDVKQLAETTTIAEPQVISLYWKNGLPSVPVTQWQLSNKPMPENSPSPGFPGYLATGSFKSPAPGKSQSFAIDLRNHISPSALTPAKYYVRVVAEQGSTYPPLIASTTVVITIAGNISNTKFGLTIKEMYPEMYANSPMPIELELLDLRIEKENESSDEPYLFVYAVAIDGGTDPTNMNLPSARVQCKHGNVLLKGTDGQDLHLYSTTKIVDVKFTESLRPIGLNFFTDIKELADNSIGAMMMSETAVYLVVIGMERDELPSWDVKKLRDNICKEIENQANDLLPKSLSKKDTSNVKIDQKKIAENVKKKAFEGIGFSVGVLIDPDDFVGVAIQKINFGQLLSADPEGIEFSFFLQANGLCTNPWASPEKIKDCTGSYLVRGRIRKKTPN